MKGEQQKIVFCEVIWSAYSKAKTQNFTENIVFFYVLGLIKVRESTCFFWNQKVCQWHFARKMIL